MQVKTFEAIDMKQALRMAREQLGPRAVIVASRTVRKDGPLFGLLGRKVLEVTAAVDDEPERKPGLAERRESEARASERPPTGPRPAPPAPGGASANAARGRPPAAPAAARPAARGRGAADARGAQSADPVLDEIRALRDTVARLDQRAGPDTSDLHADVAQIRTMLSSLVGSAHIGPDAQGAAAQKIFYFLLARGIDEPLARALVQRVVARVDSGGLADLQRLKLNLAAEMRAELSRAARGSEPSRVQFFVGPSGVGKSTTIAKLAARAVEREERVRIVTTDVHRIAAIDQTLRFGETLKVPVDVVHGADELARRVSQSDGRILIDTAGRNHRDPATLREIEELARAVPGAEVMLVLAATARAVDSRDVLRAYGELGFSRLILTKLDETRVYGELYNDVVRSERPLACVTTGQSVPEHLESLDIPGILKKVLHG